MSAPIRVAVLHYHLRRGGVTRVIENALKALRGTTVQCGVLSGEPVPDNVHIEPVEVIDALGYSTSPPKDLQAIRDAASTVLGAPPDLWHIHNHSLGKNLTVPALVQALANDGERLLLQMHDFAEDGRPGNYRLLRDGLDDVTAALYPMASHVHYATLNQRDYNYLRRAGVPESNLYILPNAVGSVELSDAGPVDSNLILYPTRAIRRKNLGEFLFWAAVSDEYNFGVTLAPENPAERPAYDRWVALADQLDLPITFGMTESTPFEQLMSGAHCLATTSMAEGFGLAFLESWVFNKRLLGRDLPDMTSEFKDAGLDLSELYARLDLPAEWIDLERLRDKLRSGLVRSFEAFGKPLKNEHVEDAYHAAVVEDYVDFGRLDEELQETMIRRAMEDSGIRQLVPSGLVDVSANRQKVLQQYGLEANTQNLTALYNSVLASKVEKTDRLKPDAVLDVFLDPKRFILLRS